MTPSNFHVFDNKQNFQFEIRIDEELAYMVYRIKSNSIYLMHTKVPEKFEGKGVASSLAKHALHYAHKNGLKVVPYCPFMRSYLEKHPIE